MTEADAIEPYTAFPGARPCLAKAPHAEMIYCTRPKDHDKRFHAAGVGDEAVTWHDHVWVRENRAPQCDCPQCRLDDPRGLTCDHRDARDDPDCNAEMRPGDADFDELYEAAPWM